MFFFVYTYGWVFNMRVISKEFRKMLEKSEVYSLFTKPRRSDYMVLDCAVERFEKWIATEHAKDCRLIVEVSSK